MSLHSQGQHLLTYPHQARVSGLLEDSLKMTTLMLVGVTGGALVGGWLGQKVTGSDTGIIAAIPGAYLGGYLGAVWASGKGA